MEDLEDLLVIGTKIKLGPNYCKEMGGKTGDIITLIEGYFDHDTTPSVWDENAKEFDSIYHLFGNNMEYFMDCEIVR